MSEPQVFIGGPRRRGRPRVDEQRTRLSTRVGDQHYDTLVKMATQRQVSLCKLTREILEQVAARQGGR